MGRTLAELVTYSQGNDGVYLIVFKQLDAINSYSTALDRDNLCN